MHRPKRTIPFALACALLAALSGCGGGDRKAADGGAAAPAENATAAAPAENATAAASCTPPPAVPFDTTDGQPWSVVAGYLETRSFTAARGKTVVRVCTGKNCVIRASIQSDEATNCVTNSPDDQALRLLGMVTADEGSAAPTLGFSSANEGNTVYLLRRAGKAYAMYQDSATHTTRYVRTTDVSGWIYDFCAHPQKPGRPAEALWKDYRTGKPIPERRGGENGRPEEEVEEEEPVPELATGWMACVNGCCRFYGSPPPPDGGNGETDVDGGRPGCPDF